MGRKSKAAIRRQEILTHFYNILKEEGLAKASISKVAQRMVVNPSLLIHYFKTKEAMTLAFVAHLLERYEARLNEILGSTQTGTPSFEKVLNSLFSEDWFHFSDPSVFYAFYYLSTRDEQIRQQFQAFYQYFGGVLLPLVKHWIDTGVLPVQDPQQVVEYLIINHEGLLYYDQLMQSTMEFRSRADYLKKTIKWVLNSGINTL